MTAPERPANEGERLKALRRYELLDTEAEQSFDDLTALAADICEAPFSMVSFVDQDRQWFKSRVGVTQSETPRDVSFCGHAILQRDVFKVFDAAADPRFADNPLVTTDPGIRFYAGAPILTPDGFALGAICVLDYQPRTLRPSQERALEGLSRQVTAHCELRRQTRELSESEARLRIVTDKSRVSMAIVNEARRYVYANRAYVELFGLGFESVVGLEVRQVLREAYEGQIRSQLDRAFGGEFVAYEICRNSRVGERFFAVQYEPTRSPAGERLVVVVIMEVTDGKQAAAESELRLRQLAENVEEVFWLVQADNSKMLYVSPAYERIWGRRTESLYTSAEDWFAAIHPEDRARIIHASATKQAAGGYDEVYRIQRPDGTIRWIHDRAFPVRDKHGDVYRIVGAAKDITEQRQLEMQMRQAQKMEAIGTLAGGIAHDFNNILGAIIGYTELAKLDADKTTPQFDFLNEVAKASLRARDLVSQILTFSRQQEQKRSPIQLRHVVAEALRLLRAATPSTIQFDTSLLSSTPIALADASQIHQIVMNLGANAVHAMRDRPGKLTTTLEGVTLEAEAATPLNLKPGIYARLSVADTGHGMDSATASRIFDPFFTTKPQGEGTGLGLAVVHGIMHAHDGAIHVTTEPELGSRFDLYFPAGSLPAVDNDTQTIDLPKGQGEHILLVDDEPNILTIGQKILERIGYRVTACATPAGALKGIQSGATKFTGVITDLTMPEMTGLDLAREALKADPSLAILLMSGNATPDTVASANALGIRQVLAKPFTTASMAKALQKLLQAKA